MAPEKWKKEPKKKFYAVLKGREGPLVYRDWPTCQASVHGCDSKYKGFATQNEAEDYMHAGGMSVFPMRKQAGSANTDTTTVTVMRDTWQSGSSTYVTTTNRKRERLDNPEDHTLKRQKLQQQADDKEAMAQERLAKARATIIQALKNTSNIVAFTDGAAVPNPGNCSYGVVLLWPLPDTSIADKLVTVPPASSDTQTRRRASAHAKFLGYGTNNIGELRGIRRALELVRDDAVRNAVTELKRVELHLFTDSKYSIEIIDGTSGAVANREIMLTIRQLMRELRQKYAIETIITWVPAHVGIEGNELADQLANEAIKIGKLLPDEGQDNIARSGFGLA